MEIQQKTLDNFIKNRKRPVNEYGLHMNKLANNTIGINKLSTKLSFDGFVLQSIKKQKVENGTTHTMHVSNAVINNTLDEKEKIYEVNSERARTSEQSPSTKTQLQQVYVLDLGKYHEIVCRKRHIKEIQEKLNLIELCQKDFKTAKSKVENSKNNFVLLFESNEFIVDTLPVNRIKPAELFPSPKRMMMDIQPKLIKDYDLPKILFNEVGTFSTILPLKQYSALEDSKTLPLPLKYRILNELFIVMETVLSMMFTRREKITFLELKRNIQQIIRKNFTELHLAQIKTLVPDFFKFSLAKSSRDYKFSIDLVVAPIYGSVNNDNIDLTKLTSWRKNEFYNSLIDIMKVHHAEYLSKLTSPIVIDKNKITRWHPEFDVESVPNINPSPLPKIEVLKPKMTTAKDILNQTHALFNYNNCLNRTPTSIMNENCNNLTQIKLPTESAKNSLKAAFNRIPKSFLIKIQSKQIEKARESMMRSVSQLDKDKMMIRLPDIARRMRTFYVQLQRNVMSIKKVIDQLRQSYPEAMTDHDWKAHLNLLLEKAPHWAVSKILEGTEYIRIDKNINFEELVIKKLRNYF